MDKLELSYFLNNTYHGRSYAAHLLVPGRTRQHHQEYEEDSIEGNDKPVTIATLPDMSVRQDNKRVRDISCGAHCLTNFTRKNGTGYPQRNCCFMMSEYAVCSKSIVSESTVRGGAQEAMDYDAVANDDDDNNNNGTNSSSNKKIAINRIYKPKQVKKVTIMTEPTAPIEKEYNDSVTNDNDGTNSSSCPIGTTKKK